MAGVSGGVINMAKMANSFERRRQLAGIEEKLWRHPAPAHESSMKIRRNQKK
jgi:hypothetical protein